ncbi:MAG TPA: hypothetical protein VKB19_12020 [Pedobacter sp.]|nr:hypothetical protein [Pedobacter sp.]
MSSLSNMDLLVVYPILLIVAVIIFYILGKKNGTEKEVIKTVTRYTGQLVSNYADETEEQYYLRCHNFISAYLTKEELRYHASNDYKSFVISFEHDEVTYAVNLEAYFNQGNTYMMFYTKIFAGVPDNKLVETSELVNRLNNALILSTLQLDYGNRAVESILIYPNVGQALNEEYFHFYFTSLVRSRQTLHAFNKVIEQDAEPALVTLDYMAI